MSIEEGYNPPPVEKVQRPKPSPPSPIMTMRDAIRGDYDPEELRAFIQERLGATIRRELKAMGFPVLPEGMIQIEKE